MLHILFELVPDNWRVDFRLGRGEGAASHSHSRIQALCWLRELRPLRATQKVGFLRFLRFYFLEFSFPAWRMWFRRFVHK